MSDQCDSCNIFHVSVMKLTLKLRTMTLVFVILFVSMVSSEQHPRYTGYQKAMKDYDFHIFSDSDSGNYSSMIFDAEEKAIFVGGRDNIYKLKSDNLKVINFVKWSPSNSAQKSCRISWKNESMCDNYITFLSLMPKGDLIACGTYAFEPAYRIVSQNDLNKVKNSISAYGVCASPYPKQQTVGVVTEYGELIAASRTSKLDPKTKRDRDKPYAFLASSYVTKSKIVNQRSKPVTTEPFPEQYFHDSADFVSRIQIGRTIYIFLNERTVEKNGILNKNLATVVRICETDNGSPRFVNRQRWSTFRKARLVCDNNDSVYNILRDITHGNGTIYGIFTKDEDVSVSAICSFMLHDFEDVFDKSKVYKRNPWKLEDNVNFVKQCQIDTRYLMGDWKNAKIAKGKEPTSYLNIATGTYISYSAHLAQNPIVSSRISLKRENILFTKVSMEQMVFADNKIVHHLYITTNNGKLITVQIIGEKACFLDEIQFDNSTIPAKAHKMMIHPILNRLYISTSKFVISLSLRACLRYASEIACSGSYDSRCTWDKHNSKCLTSTAETKLSNFKCVDIKEQWSEWGAWYVCSMTKLPLVMCRKRKCLSSCDDMHKKSLETKVCERGLDMENCISANAMIDGSWSLWSCWSPCGVHPECVGHSKIRRRTCTNPSPRFGGKPCKTNDESYQCGDCTKELFLTHWSEWSDWSLCLTTTKAKCSNSDNYCHQYSYRNCSQISGGCSGDSIKKKICSPNGILWGPWSDCNCQFKFQRRLSNYVSSCPNPSKKECVTEDLRKCQCNNSIGGDENLPSKRSLSIDNVKSAPPATANTQSGPDVTFGLYHTPLSASPLNLCLVEEATGSGIYVKTIDVVLGIVGIVTACLIVFIFIVFLLTKRKTQLLGNNHGVGRIQIEHTAFNTQICTNSSPKVNGNGNLHTLCGINSNGNLSGHDETSPNSAHEDSIESNQRTSLLNDTL